MVFLGGGRQGSQLIQNPVRFLPPSSTGRDRFLPTAQQAAKLSGGRSLSSGSGRGLDRHPACAVQLAAPTLRYYQSCKELSRPARKVKVPATEEREDRSAWAARILKEPHSSQKRLPLLEVGRSDASILLSHPGSILTPSGLRPLSPSIPNALDVLHFEGGTRPNPAPRPPSPAQVKTLHALRSVWRVAG